MAHARLPRRFQRPHTHSTTINNPPLTHPPFPPALRACPCLPLPACRAASSTKFRSTFIADPPKERKKARLSWYHPDDTMVPRDWFQGGLMEDLKYYMPFGLGSGSSAAAAEPAPAQA